MSFEILPTDKFFYNSPDTGMPECICSRCGKMIPEDEPAIRAFPTEPDDYGYDPHAEGGTEFRYHAACVGMKFAAGGLGNAFDEPGIFSPEDILP